MESRSRSPLSLLGPQEVLGERSLLHSHFRRGNISCLVPCLSLWPKLLELQEPRTGSPAPLSPGGNGWRAPRAAPPPALRPGPLPWRRLSCCFGCFRLGARFCLSCLGFSLCAMIAAFSVPTRAAASLRFLPPLPGSCCSLAGPPSFPSAPLTPLRASCLHFPRGPFCSCCCFSASAAPALTSAFCRLLPSLLPPLRPLPSSFPVLRPPPLP